MKKIRKKITVPLLLVCLGIAPVCVNAEEEEICGVPPIYNPSGYIIPESDERYLDENDICDLSLRELNYAKNEIYARHGRRFLSDELQTYFDSKTWYEGLYDPEDFDANYAFAVINDYERVNADFLAAAEYAIDPNGYPLDSGMEEWEEDMEQATYESVLREYSRGLSEEFSGTEYRYVQMSLSPVGGFYRGQKLYYAYYDFMNDGLPELVIASYWEETDDRKASYSVLDAYGTDGIMINRLDCGIGWGRNTYTFCKDNILRVDSVSGGLSTGSTGYLQLYPNEASGKLIEYISHTGYGECFRYDVSDLEDMDNLNDSDRMKRIQSFEYQEIIDSYEEDDTIPFEWQELTTNMQF